MLFLEEFTADTINCSEVCYGPLMSPSHMLSRKMLVMGTKAWHSAHTLPLHFSAMTLTDSYLLRGQGNQSICPFLSPVLFPVYSQILSQCSSHIKQHLNK